LQKTMSLVESWPLWKPRQSGIQSEISYSAEMAK
jgi:hypothetical protein